MLSRGVMGGSTSALDAKRAMQASDRTLRKLLSDPGDSAQGAPSAEPAGSAEPPPTTGEMLDSRVKVAVLGEDLHAAADCMKLITAEAGLQFGESCTDILSQLRRTLDGRRQELGSTFGKKAAEHAMKPKEFLQMQGEFLDVVREEAFAAIHAVNSHQNELLEHIREHSAFRLHELLFELVDRQGGHKKGLMTGLDRAGFRRKIEELTKENEALKQQLKGEEFLASELERNRTEKMKHVRWLNNVREELQSVTAMKHAGDMQLQEVHAQACQMQQNVEEMADEVKQLRDEREQSKRVIEKIQQAGAGEEMASLQAGRLVGKLADKLLSKIKKEPTMVLRRSEQQKQQVKDLVKSSAENTSVGGFTSAMLMVSKLKRRRQQRREEWKGGIVHGAAHAGMPTSLPPPPDWRELTARSSIAEAEVKQAQEAVLRAEAGGASPQELDKLRQLAESKAAEAAECHQAMERSLSQGSPPPNPSPAVDALEQLLDPEAKLNSGPSSDAVAISQRADAEASAAAAELAAAEAAGVPESELQQWRAHAQAKAAAAAEAHDRVSALGSAGWPSARKRAKLRGIFRTAPFTPVESFGAEPEELVLRVDGAQERVLLDTPLHDLESAVRVLEKGLQGRAGVELDGGCIVFSSPTYGESSAVVVDAEASGPRARELFTGESLQVDVNLGEELTWQENGRGQWLLKGLSDGQISRDLAEVLIQWWKAEEVALADASATLEERRDAITKRAALIRAVSRRELAGSREQGAQCNLELEDQLKGAQQRFGKGQKAGAEKPGHWVSGYWVADPWKAQPQLPAQQGHAVQALTAKMRRINQDGSSDVDVPAAGQSDAQALDHYEPGVATASMPRLQGGTTQRLPQPPPAAPRQTMTERLRTPRLPLLSGGRSIFVNEEIAKHGPPATLLSGRVGMLPMRGKVAPPPTPPGRGPWIDHINALNRRPRPPRALRPAAAQHQRLARGGEPQPPSVLVPAFLFVLSRN